MEDSAPPKAPLLNDKADLSDLEEHREFYSLDSERDRELAFSTFVKRSHSYLSMVWGSAKHKEDWCCRGNCSRMSFPLIWTSIITLVLNLYGTHYLGNASGVKAWVLSMIFAPLVHKPMVLMFQGMEWFRRKGS